MLVKDDSIFNRVTHYVIGTANNGVKKEMPLFKPY